MADAGFLEGGFCYNDVHETFMPRPLSVETTPISKRSSLKEASFSTCQSIHFRSRSLLRHAEVSHRSRFLSFSHRQEGSI